MGSVVPGFWLPLGGSGSGGGISVAVARVETSETTTSDSFTDMTTVGPAVTVTVPASGILVVNVSAQLGNDNSGGGASMTFELSGANTLAASDAYSVGYFAQAAGAYERQTRRTVLTGLTAGSTTITAKYRRANTGTAHVGLREISAEVGFTAA